MSQRKSMERSKETHMEGARSIENFNQKARTSSKDVLSSLHLAANIR
jgi:hypothetical protein